MIYLIRKKDLLDQQKMDQSDATNYVVFMYSFFVIFHGLTKPVGPSQTDFK